MENYKGEVIGKLGKTPISKIMKGNNQKMRCIEGVNITEKELPKIGLKREIGSFRSRGKSYENVKMEHIIENSNVPF